ncbi:MULTISPECIES: TetR/AcrR family transcriptional regulator [unclassified Nonomuraea]|uniref:TetR/AcrR family transcriptional regulator n=1 Tax=unclassified Nonomuraea TaxID=2593643 RepID=UPI0033D8B9E8
MVTSRRGRPAPGSELTAAAVVAAARELLGEQGLDTLSMRRVAARLDVDVSSLYWHVRSKEALLDLLADDLLGEVRPPDPRLPWRERVEALLLDYRGVLLRHRDAARILAGRWVLGPNTLRALENLLATLRSTGLGRAESAQVAYLLTSYVSGFVLQELRPMNAAEAAGTDPDQALDQVHRELKALPPEDFPHLTAVADELTARTLDERFRRGIALMLNGLETGRTSEPLG